MSTECAERAVLECKLEWQIKTLQVFTGILVSLKRADTTTKDRTFLVSHQSLTEI